MALESVTQAQAGTLQPEEESTVLLAWRAGIFQDSV